MNYQSTYTVSPSNGSTGTWQCDGQLIPNPLTFGGLTRTDSVGTTITEFVNQQVNGAAAPDRLLEFTQEFTRWRLAYASVTIYQDGPDLSNQGTVVVCQKPVQPLIIHPSLGHSAATMTNASPALRPAAVLLNSDYPNYATSQTMPNSYFGRSKEGVYIPLKLTKTHQEWHSAADMNYMMVNTTFPTGFADANQGFQAILPEQAAANLSGFYPFPSLNYLHVKTNTTVSDQLFGTLIPAFCNENWADFSFRNLSVSTSLSFFFRFGFECQVQPSSVMAPHLKLSPSFDPTAVEMYFKIARELKDAYPADFNDLGKIWDVISSIAKTVSPFLVAVPEIGPILAPGVTTAAMIGDKIRDATRRVKAAPTLGNTASASDLQTVRAAQTLNIQPTSQPANNGRFGYNGPVAFSDGMGNGMGFYGPAPRPQRKPRKKNSAKKQRRAQRVAARSRR